MKKQKIIFNKKLGRFTRGGKIIKASLGRKSTPARIAHNKYLKTKSKPSSKTVTTTNKMIGKRMQGLTLYTGSKAGQFKINTLATPYFDNKTKLLLPRKQLPATTTKFNRAIVYYSIEIQVGNLPPFNDIWTFEYTAFNDPLTYKQFVKRINANVGHVQKKYLAAITMKHSMQEFGDQKQFYFQGIEAIKLYRGKKPDDKKDRGKSNSHRRNKTSKKRN